MIERLQRIASFLARLEPLILLLGLGFLSLFVASLFGLGGVRNDALMMPAIAGFCWAALLFSVARLFAAVPEKPTPQHSFGRRLALRLRRAAVAFVALAMAALTGTVLVLSYQMLRLFLAG